jgi:hypothetical protein
MFGKYVVKKSSDHEVDGAATTTFSALTLLYCKFITIHTKKLHVLSYVAKDNFCGFRKQPQVMQALEPPGPILA